MPRALVPPLALSSGAGCDVSQSLGFLLPFGLSVKAACPNFGTGHGNLLLGACSWMSITPEAVRRGFFSPAKLPHGTALCMALRRALPSLSLYVDVLLCSAP